MRMITLAAIAAAMAAGCPQAEAADLRAKPVLKAPPPPPSVGGFWIAAEYLNWSTKGDKPPPLVTTSPPGTLQGQAGVLGVPGTSVLFGNGSTADGWRSGARLRGGYWFDPQRTEGVEAQFFTLGRSSTDFSFSSSGNPILANPFVDAVSGLQLAKLVAFPGVDSGSVSISDTSQLFGAGAVYRREFCKTCLFGSVSGLIGYRFMRLHDGLSISGASVAVGSAGIPAGSAFATADQFDTVNNFHGLDLGLTGDVANGPWRLTWLAKLAVGGTFTQLNINGSNVITVPGIGSTASAGGFYSQPTNIGNESSSRFAVAPELGLNVGYQVTDRLRALAGYSLLYWTGLVRAGGAIDTTINLSQAGGGTLVGPARPQAQLNTTDYWAQGFNLGLVYNY
jgi:hypothetical protein